MHYNGSFDHLAAMGTLENQFNEALQLGGKAENLKPGYDLMFKGASSSFKECAENHLGVHSIWDKLGGKRFSKDGEMNGDRPVSVYDDGKIHSVLSGMIRSKPPYRRTCEELLELLYFKENSSAQ